MEDAPMHPELETDDAGLLQPIAVPIRVAQKLLGDKAHSSIYECLGRGQLRALKDGVKTLILVSSIKKYLANLPAAMR
jgi:hypothetical protein